MRVQPACLNPFLTLYSLVASKARVSEFAVLPRESARAPRRRSTVRFRSSELLQRQLGEPAMASTAEATKPRINATRPENLHSSAKRTSRAALLEQYSQLLPLQPATKQSYTQTLLSRFGLGSHAPLAARQVAAEWDDITQSVWVKDDNDMMRLWRQGFFGKGFLSRSEPSWKRRVENRRAELEGREKSTSLGWSELSKGRIAHPDSPHRRTDGRRDHGTATSRTQGRQTRKEARTRRRETRRRFRFRCRHRLRLFLLCTCPFRFRTRDPYGDSNGIPERWRANQRTRGGREDRTDCGGQKGQGESGRDRGCRPRSGGGSGRSGRDTGSTSGSVATRRRACATPTGGGVLPLVRSRNTRPRPARSLPPLLLFRCVTFQQFSATTLHSRNFPPLPRVSSNRRRPTLSDRSPRSPIEPTRLALLALVCRLSPLPKYGLGRTEWDQVLRRLGPVRTRWTGRRTRRVRHSGGCTWLLSGCFGSRARSLTERLHGSTDSPS